MGNTDVDVEIVIVHKTIIIYLNITFNLFYIIRIMHDVR